jgi:hypothetical protein
MARLEGESRRDQNKVQKGKKTKNFTSGGLEGGETLTMGGKGEQKEREWLKG